MKITEIYNIQHRENITIVGIMGGIASGKSTIAKAFQNLGAIIINADKMAHEVLKDSDVLKQITGAWGENLIVNGEIDRKQLGKIVFSSKTELTKLENLIHPILRKNVKNKLEKLATQGKHVIVLDVALLWEHGWYKGCDYLLFIDTTYELRQQRTIKERGWDKDELAKREKFQTNLNKKKEVANFIIFNTKNLPNTNKQVSEIWEKLKPN